MLYFVTTLTFVVHILQTPQHLLGLNLSSNNSLSCHEPYFLNLPEGLET